MAGLVTTTTSPFLVSPQVPVPMTTFPMTTHSRWDRYLGMTAAMTQESVPTANAVEQLGGCLHDGNGAVGGGDEPELLILPVLQQVFAEGIGADEDAHDGCHRVLPAELLGTTAGVVGDMRTQLVLVCYHPAEGTAGADALLLRQLLIGHDVLAVELLPCAHDVDIAITAMSPSSMPTSIIESPFTRP